MTGLAVCRDGSYAVLAGASTLVSIFANSAGSAQSKHAAQYVRASFKQDRDCTTLLCVDLTKGKGSLLKQSAPSEQRKAFPIHADLFCHRPGLRILQITWHPGSSKFSLDSKLSPWHVDRNALTHPDLFLVTPVLSVVTQITPSAPPLRYSSVFMQAVTCTLLC